MSSVKVMPPAVIICVAGCSLPGCCCGIGMVVLCVPMPLGPREIVCPPITTVVGVVPGERVKVWVPIITVEPISVRGTLPIVRTCVVGADPAGWIVVLGKPTPPGPTEIVWPLMTVVVGAAPGPMLNVELPIMATEDPTATVTPFTTVGVGMPAGADVTSGVGRSIVVPGAITCDGLTVNT